MGEALALGVALCYGITHFCSGVLARRAGGIAVAFYAQVGGSVIIIVLAIAFPVGDVTWPALTWGALSGVAAGLGMAFLYRGLSRGKISIVAPVSDVNAAVIPALFGIVLLGERPSAIVLLGMAAALPAIWLVSRSPEAAHRPGDHPAVHVAPATAPGAATALATMPKRRALPPGVLDGMLAGLGIALTWVALERVPAGTGLLPLVASRLVSVASIIPLVITTRSSLRIPPKIALWAAIAGSIGTLGTLSYMMATREQLLAIVSVLAALYPAIPVLLAMVILRERITSSQAIGLVAGAAAISIIAVN